MSLDNTIDINERLLDREALFMRVHELEQRIDTILGQPYPLDIPLELPSSKKRRKPAKKKSVTKAKRLKVRKLEQGEVAYLIEYELGGQNFKEEHYDNPSLERFINEPMPGLRICSVKVIQENRENSERIL